MATLICNIGTLLSGDLAEPILEADQVLIVDGTIAAIGSGIEAEVELTIDAQGATVAPGLIDSHCHVVFGDYTPRQTAIGFLASYVHGGITTVISPGEIHLPGRPSDAAGVKALAVLAAKSWALNRPGGMKVKGGSIVLEPVLTAADFAEVAAEGVKLAKYGFGRYPDPSDGHNQIKWAQQAGIIVTCHSGGASIPGSKPITTDHLLALRPDVCGHLNGGPTSLNEDGLATIITETDMAVQIVQAGNIRSAVQLANLAAEHDQLSRVVIGSDTPTGTGTMPLGVIKTVAELSSLTDLDPAVVWAMATGNSTAVYRLDTGLVEVGRPADLIVMDAPWGSLAPDALSALKRGDIPGISAVLIDGEIRGLTSRNTPAAARSARTDPPQAQPAGSAHVC
jgi:enamidase